MAEAIPIPPGRMSREEFYQWAERQPRGRYELLAGRVVAMAPERGAHLRGKLAVAVALRDAIRQAGLHCQALPDGATIQVGDDTAYEPDATVNCGQPMGENDIVAPNPVIVVEVISPSTSSVDTGVKLADYFRVPSIAHYLILRMDRKLVIHHRRRPEGGVDTQILHGGGLALDPPGIAVQVESFFED
jgi:Uma2 family endonuclease